MVSSSSVKSSNPTEPVLPPPHYSTHQISFGMMQSSFPPPPGNNNYLNNNNSKDCGGGAYDLGELDQALFLYLDGQQHPSSTLQHRKQNSSSSGMRPPTLNIFPSKPMHVVEPPSSSNSKGKMELVSSQITQGSSKRPSEAASKGKEAASAAAAAQQSLPKQNPKILRRLAQNREAAKRSRLRKKAYVQQLESSRVRLDQLEQELQRARAQALFFGGGGEQGLPVPVNAITPEAAVFDVEYARWEEEHQQVVWELRVAVQEEVPEKELVVFVENYLAHYDQVMGLKGLMAKADVFHLVSGMWKTPAERCFMWIGGFRPSQLLKIIGSQNEALTDEQIMGICGLQQSTQEAEQALSHGLEALNHSLLESLTLGDMPLAFNKLSTLEGFVKQADYLRQQTFRRLHQILTTQQAARCFLAIAEYFHRLRALSSLWLARPRQE